MRTKIVKQFGRRRGANMGILNVSHNDIVYFIRAKHVEEQSEELGIAGFVPEEFSWSFVQQTGPVRDGAGTGDWPPVVDIFRNCRGDLEKWRTRHSF